MKKYSTFLILLLLTQFYFIQAQQSSWKMVGGKIASPWAEKVNPANPLPEYPRPHMIRQTWMNLNGLWDYALVPKSQGESKPSAFAGQILVPFPVESALSGVGKKAGKDTLLWYKRTISIPANFKKGKVLLHFGAADWQCEVFVNGKKAGAHQGGYDPFSFDITPLLKGGNQQEVSVKIWDPSNDGPQPRGKQIKNPHGIWYTPVTGIWQTVWLEAVPQTYITSTKHTPDIDKQTLTIQSQVQNLQSGDKLKITAWDGKTKVAEKEVAANTEAVLQVNNPKLWSPENPFLYDLSIAVVRKGKVVDEIKSYFAMRKISMQPDSKGMLRMLLNNQFVFQYGPLDQGWWPDGLYTAPTDKALKFDIEKTKEMGFNMIRKHVKVEPARWYYHCDKLGMLVWQDMPSGDMGNRWDSRPGIIGRATEKERTAESEQIFRTEWKAIMDATYNFPSIVVWVPFNEAWGQFKTEEITKWTMDYDKSRLVNSASGGNFHKVGHIIDLHNYPEPAMPQPDLFGKEQIIVLGEFGGLGLPLEDHTWQQKDNWGYQSFKNADELFAKYEEFMNSLAGMIGKGLSAAVYTQTTDVEVETNGLMTYDRKVIKVPEAKLKQVHSKLYNPALGSLKE
ncbi:glycoside hydrolase family 2 TIM barrel-domain containing protein [Rhodocytophaga aerolata]|uniref:Glycoside hydrolase family 2 TIM barrel-domain containing protein n=1 Tax=Rhodocytophaga aerolata TaxID=455078 RepID=A0ABT8RBH6_9BACT|nr:sugar-binding domain-containing protein [Rhodocytophaga aerolata]MDO1449461.1 glycoside hydrolase family 2 TIM barrel-domain containing protein [Rhodocytophaga aerolata]